MYGGHPAFNVMAKRRMAAEKMTGISTADLEAFVSEYYGTHKNSAVSRLAPFDKVDSEFYRYLGAVDLIREREGNEAVWRTMGKRGPKTLYEKIVHAITGKIFEIGD